MNLWERAKNLYFWSSISARDAKENPHSFITQAVNKQEMKGEAYIIGMNEEEQNAWDSFKANEKPV